MGIQSAIMRLASVRARVARPGFFRLVAPTALCLRKISAIPA
jgi:hypothetical protein